VHETVVAGAVTDRVFKQLPVTEVGTLNAKFTVPVAAALIVAVSVTVSPRTTLVTVPDGVPVDTALNTMVPRVVTVY